jgi:transcriptional regulator with XRE-family HTH domain
MAEVVAEQVLVAFGEALRRLRKQGGMSQEHLAELAGLHRTYIGSIERGERNLSLINIHRLAAALGIDVPTLMAAAAEAHE